MVADLGAAFGNTGNTVTRSKDSPREYADSTFVKSGTPASLILSSSQIRACFRAAGYTPDQIGAYAQTVRRRIAELNAL